MAKTFFLITETRRVYHPVTGRQSSFPAGIFVSAAKFYRSGVKNVAGWAKQLTEIEARILNACKNVDRDNTVKFDVSPAQREKMEKVSNILMNERGLARTDFAFGYGPSVRSANVDKDTLWVIIKLTDLDGRLINRENKPVSLAWDTGNSVAVDTFLRRYENGQRLFVG